MIPVQGAAPDRLAAAWQFLARCHAEPDLGQLVEAFRAAIARFGFSHSALGSWAGTGADTLSRFYFNDWPAGWMEIYHRENALAHDPAVELSRRSMSPFLWSELRASPSLSAAARRVVALGDAYGWGQGLCVPIHGPASYCGLVTMVAKTHFTPDAADIAALELMALAIHRRCRASPGFGFGPPPPSALTERQLQCLRWVASGKTDAEIAAQLGISKATVHFHIERAKKQLGVSSRVQAVAMLMLGGSL